MKMFLNGRPVKVNNIINVNIAHMVEHMGHPACLECSICWFIDLSKWRAILRSTERGAVELAPPCKWVLWKQAEGDVRDLMSSKIFLNHISHVLYDKNQWSKFFFAGEGHTLPVPFHIFLYFFLFKLLYCLQNTLLGAWGKAYQVLSCFVEKVDF